MAYIQMKQIREDHDLSQKDVADYLGIARSTYASYEIGIRPVPAKYVSRLADFYKTSTDYLLGRTQIQVPYPAQNTK